MPSSNTINLITEMHPNEKILEEFPNKKFKKYEHKNVQTQRRQGQRDE